MFNEYDAARANLRKLGLERGVIDTSIRYAKSIIRAAIQGDQAGLREQEARLEALCNEHNLTERIYSKPILRFDEGAEKIRNTPTPALIGITGKPASGKSTLLTYFSQLPNTTVLDEFWPLEETYEQMEQTVTEALSRGERVIVASCILEGKFDKTGYHLITSPDSRRENLTRRARTITDDLRGRYFSAFEWLDLVLYESEAVNASFLIDSSKIKY